MKKTQKISKEVLALRRTKAYRKAYTDDDFMSRRELRPVRLQLELLKPELALAEHDIKTTVVVFGSARTRSASLRTSRPAVPSRYASGRVRSGQCRCQYAELA